MGFSSTCGSANHVAHRLGRAGVTGICACQAGDGGSPRGAAIVQDSGFRPWCDRHATFRRQPRTAPRHRGAGREACRTRSSTRTASGCRDVGGDGAKKHPTPRMMSGSCPRRQQVGPLPPSCCRTGTLASAVSRAAERRNGRPLYARAAARHLYAGRESRRTRLISQESWWKRRSADIDRPEIERGLAGHDPFGRAMPAPPELRAPRVEAAPEEASPAGLAQDVVNRAELQPVMNV